MTNNYTTRILPKYLIFFLLALPVMAFSRTGDGVGDPGNPDSLAKNTLGHVSCNIHRDTNCVTKLVTLEAWIDWIFTGVSEPVVVPWSTGVTAHKIEVTPPGTWSWDVSSIGCEVVHQFNTITFDSPFFSGPVEISSLIPVCALDPVVLTVNTLGYSSFSSFEWSPASPQLTPYVIEQPGHYALTVTDAFGCSFTDDINVVQAPQGQESCNQSCVFCDFDGTVGTNNGPPTGGNLVCSQISVHNNLWYGFVAGSDTISIDVITSNCQTGDGLQIALFDNCDDSDAITCNPGCGGCGNLTLSLQYSNFIPGETYWLMLDGYVGDVCDFEIDITQGSVTAPAPAPVAQPVGPHVVCPGATAVYTVPNAAGAGYYHWTAPAGASINGLSNNENIDAPSGATVTITFGIAGGQVCVQAGNSCLPASAQQCLQVGIQPIPPTIKPPIMICSEDLPFTWDEEPFTTLITSGTFTLTSSLYHSYLGCDSVVRQTIIVKPPLITNLSPVTLCVGECFTIGSELICDPGFFSVVLESYQGCDSVVNVGIVVLEPIAVIQGPAEILCGQSSITLQSAPSPATSVKVWRDLSGQILATGPSLVVTVAGTYILRTSMSGGGVTCVQSDTIVVLDNSSVLEVQIAGAADGCMVDTLILSAVVAVGDAQFEWSGPNGFTSSEQSPAVTMPGNYFVAVTTPGGCSGTVAASVTAVGGPPSATTQNDTLTCIHTIGQLNGGAAIAGTTFSWTGPGGFLSTLEDPMVSIPGAYQLSVTSPGGCTDTEIAYLLDNTNGPTIELPDALIICTTNPALLCTTSAANPGYAWSGPNGFVSTLAQPIVALAGNYVVTVTDLANGCTATADAMVSYEELALVILPEIIVQPIIGQNNGSIDISISGNPDALSYAWYSNGVLIGSTQDINNLGAGVYTVLVSNIYGCTASEMFDLQAVSATNNIQDVAAWTIRPNPSSGRFELCCHDGNRSATQVLVHDYSGRLLLQQPVGANQQEILIDLSEAPVGVYFLEIRDEARSTWIKLVVQR
jgi:hypothetical protein